MKNCILITNRFLKIHQSVLDREKDRDRQTDRIYTSICRSAIRTQPWRNNNISAAKSKSATTTPHARMTSNKAQEIDYRSVSAAVCVDKSKFSYRFGAEKMRPSNPLPVCQNRIYVRICVHSAAESMGMYRGGQKPGLFVLRLVTSEMLIRSASNLASIKIILFLTLIRHLFELSLENKVAPSSEWQ